MLKYILEFRLVPTQGYMYVFFDSMYFNFRPKTGPTFDEMSQDFFLEDDYFLNLMDLKNFNRVLKN